jgi:hypothetical protein
MREVLESDLGGYRPQCQCPVRLGRVEPASDPARIATPAAKSVPTCSNRARNVIPVRRVTSTACGEGGSPGKRPKVGHTRIPGTAPRPHRHDHAAVHVHLGATVQEPPGQPLLPGSSDQLLK